MSRRSRVMWSEGMFLLPQHFQYQDEYHQHQLAQAVQRGTPFHWGIEQLEVDEDALAGGTLSLKRLKLVFPDGTLYDAPQQDALPAVRDLRERAREGELKVYVALRHGEPYGVNYVDDGDEGKAPKRFRKRFEVLPDLNEGDLENEITSLGLNVVLLIEGDSLDGYSYCPLLQLTRNSAGGFGLASAFISPCLYLGASDQLLSLARRLLGVLQAKSDALSSRRRERANLIAEFGSSDVTLFWLLNTVNRAYPQLAHLLQHPRLHPERLYLFLAELAGGLLTFSLDAGLADIPEYDHDDPAASLQRLDVLLRELLDNVVPNQYVPITLEQSKTSYYIGRLHDARLTSADFYISVHADMPGAKLLELVPRAFKVGSPEDIEVVVNTAMPGASLVHTTRLPSAIPVRLDNHYFAIEPRGEVFERMMRAQAVAFYVPSAFTNLKLELMAVLK
ncbi:type VI secretion system baseplate subunit TssK [Pseudomonas aeruginosa]|uniref:type VI secretion system baseplate subunit TssK n=1 Tax=Pseudomonas aeruginosa TaxID=287 RepID=UPI00053EC844|nr:type VI secretion system baseplate subunit TssK [Pseudomonas aeruginosa]WCV80991.1 type VI secretion system baseplate subunit TssK [Pseudomonas aeruginosa]HBO0859711.1 type VI secretion system baseplate subunit TssK [Pseudomonas aeruginosa]HCE6879262.1 type VI secretion system baseplate subunit TssK [Pseudomonas aeruginosa]HDR2971474.1 type VI secretion system baseplate subunit TssK [Pseudomonas aeruginosa]